MVGLAEYFILVFVVLVLAGITSWAVKSFAPDRPAVADKIIWGVAILVIVYKLAQALGFTGLDPTIPHL